MAQVGEVDIEEEIIKKAYRGKVSDLRQLLENNESVVNYTNEDGCTALHAAAAAGQLEVVEYLIGLPQVDLEAVDTDEQSVMQYAAYYGHLEVVQCLVQRGMPLDIPDKFGRLPHNAAAINGHLDVVEYLLDELGPQAISVNSIDQYGCTALHWAALKGRKEVVQYLVYKGIDVHRTSYDNKTAYQLAKDRHKTKCAAFLKEWLEQVNTFLKAVSEGDLVTVDEVIKKVKDKCPITYLRNKDGRNALHIAAAEGRLEILKRVLSLCDNPRDTDKYGRTALHYAALYGHKDCALWLVKKGKGTELIHSRTLTEKSASRCAFEMGHAELAAWLQGVEEGHEEAAEADEEEKEDEQVKVSQTDEAAADPRTSKEYTGQHEVSNWLKAIKMEEYANLFHADGFDTLRGVVTLNESDLVDMKVKKGHRRLILSKIEDLTSQLRILDRQAAEQGKEANADPHMEELPPVPSLSAKMDSISSGHSTTVSQPLLSSASGSPSNSQAQQTQQQPQSQQQQAQQQQQPQQQPQPQSMPLAQSGQGYTSQPPQMPAHFPQHQHQGHIVAQSQTSSSHTRGSAQYTTSQPQYSSQSTLPINQQPQQQHMVHLVGTQPSPQYAQQTSLVSGGSSGYVGSSVSTSAGLPSPSIHQTHSFPALPTGHQSHVNSRTSYASISPSGSASLGSSPMAESHLGAFTGGNGLRLAPQQGSEHRMPIEDTTGAYSDPHLRSSHSNSEGNGAEEYHASPAGSDGERHGQSYQMNFSQGLPPSQVTNYSAPMSTSMGYSSSNSGQPVYHQSSPTIFAQRSEVQGQVSVQSGGQVSEQPQQNMQGYLQEPTQLHTQPPQQSRPPPAPVQQHLQQLQDSPPSLAQQHHNNQISQQQGHSHQGHPSEQQQGPTVQEGLSLQQQGSSSQQQGPSSLQHGPSTQQQGRSTQQQGPSTQQHGPSMQQQGPSTQQQGSSTQLQGSSAQQPDFTTQHQPQQHVPPSAQDMHHLSQRGSPLSTQYTPLPLPQPEGSCAAPSTVNRETSTSNRQQPAQGGYSSHSAGVAEELQADRDGSGARTEQASLGNDTIGDGDTPSAHLNSELPGADSHERTNRTPQTVSQSELSSAMNAKWDTESGRNEVSAGESGARDSSLVVPDHTDHGNVSKEARNPNAIIEASNEANASEDRSTIGKTLMEDRESLLSSREQSAVAERQQQDDCQSTGRSNSTCHPAFASSSVPISSAEAVDNLANASKSRENPDRSSGPAKQEVHPLKCQNDDNVAERERRASPETSQAQS